MYFDDENSTNGWSFNEELLLQGLPVSDGIAIGMPFFLFEDSSKDVPEFMIAAAEIEEEIVRYRKAIYSSREDLELLRVNLSNEGSTEAAMIIDAHIEMLDDPVLKLVEDEIRAKRQNTEVVFRAAIAEIEKQISQGKDTYIEQRINDVKDLSKRILRHLFAKQKVSFADIPPNSVVIASELPPSDAAEAQASRVAAIVTRQGGGASHTGLIVRAKGIPCVDNIDTKLIEAKSKNCVIVDGSNGKVIVNPKMETLQKYDGLKKRFRKEFIEISQKVSYNDTTLDGHQIKLLANIESIHDLDLVLNYGAMGVGLFRSEYLFLHREVFSFSEDEQFAVYSQILRKANNLPIVIRVFDIGGDKISDIFFETSSTFPINRLSEINPALGCRAIRLLLKQRNVFRTQLRAILRASIYGDVRILLPLISDVAEVLEAKNFIDEVRKELEYEGIKIKEKIPLGAMIEVPSAVITADLMAEECDFFSIGTNDLTQYALAVDRADPRMRDLYQPAHPTMLRMITKVVEEAKKRDIPVTLCGEMASNPLYTELLIGLGIKELSCPPRFIPIIRNILNKIEYSSAQKLAETTLNLKSHRDIHQLLTKELESKRVI